MSKDRKELSEAGSFEVLDVFERVYRIFLEVHRADLCFSDGKHRAMADQVRRVSKSICASIAEGFGRRSQAPANFQRFLTVAVGSSNEMRVWPASVSI